jgi:hypothetical protein
MSCNIRLLLWFSVFPMTISIVDLIVPLFDNYQLQRRHTILYDHETLNLYQEYIRHLGPVLRLRGGVTIGRLVAEGKLANLTEFPVCLALLSNRFNHVMAASPTPSFIIGFAMPRSPD